MQPKNERRGKKKCLFALVETFTRKNQISWLLRKEMKLRMSRRGFTIRLKRLKPRVPDFEGPQNVGSKDNFQHFCKKLYLYIFLVQRKFFYYAAKKRFL